MAPQGTGLAGPGVQAITALTATGATLTGVGFTATSAATSGVDADRADHLAVAGPVVTTIT